MPNQDTSEVKNRILSLIRMKGPSLPVHIAKDINLSTLFASAFLSELISEKKIKTSNLRVGNSPLYLLPGQEPMLERFSNHLKSKEKEAFVILKGKQFLRDSSQLPAIRVALRGIRDFAIPFKRNEEIFWRYFTSPESEFKEPSRTLKKEKEIPAEKLDIFDKKEKPKIKKKAPKKKTPQKANEKFFNRVKEFLLKKSIEITGIEGFNKSELTLKIKKEEKEMLLIAYNKKRIIEKDLIKANEKAQEFGLPYTVLNLAEPSKKLKNFIEAVKNLESMEKME